MRRKTAEEIAAGKGARWLDKHHPGWFEKIDLRLLRLQNTRMCILGQCFGEFWAALTQITGEDEGGERGSKWARVYGFNAARTTRDTLVKGSYERLGLAWAPLVAIRQVKAAQAPLVDVLPSSATETAA